MSGTQQEKFETWALVELFGHNRIVGLVTEQAVGGASFIRVDVPDADGQTRFTRLFGAAAIYAINPVEKAVAIQLAQRCGAARVQAYELPQLPAGNGDDGEDEDGDEDVELA